MLVTGGSGTLGTLLTAALEHPEREVVALSRRPRAAGDRFTWRVGDLRTGAGLDSALEGVHTVVHCATSVSRADLDQTRRLTQAASAAGVAHVVYPSIVGVDRIGYRYYRAKLACEEHLAQSGLGWTVLRATQFHELIDRALGVLSRAPVVAVPSSTSFQPVAAVEVAARLAALVDGPPAGRVPQLAGPQVLAARELAASYLRAHGRRRPVIGVRLPGAVFAGYRRGDHLAPQDPTGRTTFDQWLAERAHRAVVS